MATGLKSVLLVLVIVQELSGLCVKSEDLFHIGLSITRELSLESIPNTVVALTMSV